MRNWILSLLVVFFVTATPPAAPECEKEFLAVFTMPGTNGDWDKYHPDLYFVATAWKDLDNFLYLVKKQAHGRKIVIDVDSHGSPDTKLLYLQYVDPHGNLWSSQTTTGYIINRIDASLGKENKVLILEACFAGNCYKSTMRGNKTSTKEADKIFNHPGVPKFPVYGVSNIANYNNTCFLQYKYHVNVSIEDLRKYETTLLAPPDETEGSDRLVAILVTRRILFYFGAP